MAKRVEAMELTIARALYEVPVADGAPKRFSDLPAARQEPLIIDARRVIDAMKQQAWCFAEFSYEMGGVDWLANQPDELWTDWLDSCLRKRGPSPHCMTDDNEMCFACDCWKATREACS